MSIESTWIVGRSQAESSGGMVAAKTPEAARAGAQVLRDGGNAIDAAVVTALVAGVSEQWMNGVGGGGFLVRHDTAANETDVVAYPMVSPLSARPEMYPLTGTGNDSALFGWPIVADNANIVGHRAVCVPGAVDGLSRALERWGTISWAAALEPAIDCAESGFPVHWHTSLRIGADLENLTRFPATADVFCPGGVPPWSQQGVPAKVIRQPDLALSLRRLADSGPREFYEGELARIIVDHLNEGGAHFTSEDFSHYEAAFEKPLTVNYHGQTVTTIGNGTGGTTLAESLLLLDEMLDGTQEPGSAKLLDRLARAFAAAFADRFAYLADPDFAEVPLDALLSDSYVEERAAELGESDPRSPRAGTKQRLGVAHQLQPSIPDYTSGG
ncbi:MAG: gamma-glutamyltransferase, partial [Thermomicrobiales bacterium]